MLRKIKIQRKFINIISPHTTLEYWQYFLILYYFQFNMRRLWKTFWRMNFTKIWAKYNFHISAWNVSISFPRRFRRDDIQFYQCVIDILVCFVSSTAVPSPFWQRFWCIDNGVICSCKFWFFRRNIILKNIKTCFMSSTAISSPFWQRFWCLDNDVIHSCKFWFFRRNIILKNIKTCFVSSTAVPSPFWRRFLMSQQLCYLFV